MMAPDAATADQAYRTLKAHIMSARFPPGTMFNVHGLANEIGISITPVRDAMERLVGERLITARAGGGFEMPQVSVETLSDLYLWNAFLLRTALSQAPAAGAQDGMVAFIETVDPDDDAALVDGTATLFLLLSQGARLCEHRAAVRSVNDRLQSVRFAERRLRDRKSELLRLATLSESGSLEALRNALSVYHRRRARHLPAILDLLRAGPAVRI